MHLRYALIASSNTLCRVSDATVSTFLHAMGAGWRENSLASLFSSFPALLSAFNSFNWKDEGIQLINSSCSGALFRFHSVKYLQRCLTVRWVCCRRGGWVCARSQLCLAQPRHLQTQIQFKNESLFFFFKSPLNYFKEVWMIKHKSKLVILFLCCILYLFFLKFVALSCRDPYMLCQYSNQTSELS